MDPESLESLEIMVKLSDDTLTDVGQQHSRHRLAHVLDVAEYLLLTEDYLESIIQSYFLSDPLGTRHEPQFLLSIRDLYSSGYTSLANHLYILWGSREPHAFSLALHLFPDIFAGTDFFWDYSVATLSNKIFVLYLI